MSESIRAVADDSEAADEGSYIVLTTETGEAELLVPPPGKWKSRAHTFMGQGMFDLWAQITLSTEDFKAWRDLDPTLDDVVAFTDAWGKAEGQTTRKNRQERRSKTKSSRK